LISQEKNVGKKKNQTEFPLSQKWYVNYAIIAIASLIFGIWSGHLTAVILIHIYFIPGIFAFCRNHTNKEEIWGANMFMGWTVVGWFICLFKALGNPRKEY